MKFTNTAVAGTVEILAADKFVALPVCIAGAALVKAGTPIKKDGTVLTAATGMDGMLLYDVDPTENPNGAMLVQGVVDLTKANRHTGLSLTAGDVQGAVPGIVCRTNIGVNA